MDFIKKCLEFSTVCQIKHV